MGGKRKNAPPSDATLTPEQPELARRRPDEELAACDAVEDAGPAAISDELLCPLCFELLHEPVETACQHVFCAHCHSRIFEVRKPGDAYAVPPAERKRDCPMCRRSISLGEARRHSELASRIAAQHPGQHAQRAEDVRKERERLASRQVEYVKLHVGNTHTLRLGQGSNSHDWTFFVRTEREGDEERLIDRVVVRLHPTFRPATISLDSPPFAVRRLGWGVFVVTAIVMFKAEWNAEPLVAHWMLDFEGEGSQREIDLELVKESAAGGGAAGQGDPANHHEQQQQGAPPLVAPGEEQGQQAAAGTAAAGGTRGAAGGMGGDWREAILRGLAAVGDDDEDESWHPQGDEESEEEFGEGGEGGGEPGSDAYRDSDEEEGRLRELAGDYDISRYRTIYGSPRSSSEDEGPIYNEDWEDEEEGRAGSDGGRGDEGAHSGDDEG